jgi:hypothetical protein
MEGLFSLKTTQYEVLYNFFFVQMANNKLNWSLIQ